MRCNLRHGELLSNKHWPMACVCFMHQSFLVMDIQIRVWNFQVMLTLTCITDCTVYQHSTTLPSIPELAVWLLSGTYPRQFTSYMYLILCVFNSCWCSIFQCFALGLHWSSWIFSSSPIHMNCVYACATPGGLLVYFSSYPWLYKHFFWVNTSKIIRRCWEFLCSIERGTFFLFYCTCCRIWFHSLNDVEFCWWQ